MTYRIYSGPRGSQAIAPLEKDRLLYKECDTLDGALAWARHVNDGGRVTLLIEGDDGTHLGKQEIAGALHHREARRANVGRALRTSDAVRLLRVGRSVNSWMRGPEKGRAPDQRTGDYPVIRFQPARVAALTSSKFLATTSQLTILAPPAPAALSATYAPPTVSATPKMIPRIRRIGSPPCRSRSQARKPGRRRLCVSWLGQGRGP
jgi:hypothetical protein